jgi:hypothetical protein
MMTTLFDVAHGAGLASDTPAIASGSEVALIAEVFWPLSLTSRPQESRMSATATMESEARVGSQPTATPPTETNQVARAYIQSDEPRAGSTI